MTVPLPRFLLQRQTSHMDLHELPHQPPQQAEKNEGGLAGISDRELAVETERTARAVDKMSDTLAIDATRLSVFQHLVASDPQLLEMYNTSKEVYRRTLERTEAKLRACKAETKRRREEEADCPLVCDVPHPDCKQKEIKALMHHAMEVSEVRELDQSQIQKFTKQELENLQQAMTETLRGCIRQVTDDPVWRNLHGHIQLGSGEEGPLQWKIGNRDICLQTSLKVIRDPCPHLMVQCIQVEPRGHSIGPIFYLALLKLLHAKAIGSKDDPLYNQGTPRLLAATVNLANQKIYDKWNGVHFQATRRTQDMNTDVDYWIDPLPKPCAEEPVAKRPRRRAAIDGEAKRHKTDKKLEETKEYSRGFGRRVTQ